MSHVLFYLYATGNLAIPNVLYHDIQSTVQNAFFTAAKSGGGGGTHLVTDTMVLSANYAKLQLGPPPPTVSTKCNNCIS